MGYVSNWLNNVIDKIKDKKQLASFDKDKLNKNLRKKDTVNVDLLVSKRTYGKGSDNSYLSDDAVVGSLNEYDGETTVEVPSTAIDQAKYDKENKVCWVKYKNNSKWYKFINVDEPEFLSFMDSFSKGKFVNNIMKVKNRDTSYV